MEEDTSFSAHAVPQTQSESDRAGSGKPPGRTAVGLAEWEPESKPVGWFRHFLNGLLGLFLGVHGDLEKKSD
jgi:hypothetical protein